MGNMLAEVVSGEDSLMKHPSDVFVDVGPNCFQEVERSRVAVLGVGVEEPKPGVKSDSLEG